MSKLAVCTPIIPGVTAKHLRIIEGVMECRKAALQKEFEIRQRRYADKWSSTVKRVEELANHRAFEKHKMIAKNEKLREIYQIRLNKLRQKEIYDRLDLIVTLKFRDKQKMANIEYLRQMKRNKKRDDQIKRYTTKFSRQEWAFKNKAILINECVENKQFYEKLAAEMNEQISEESVIEQESSGSESSEHCPLTQNEESLVQIECKNSKVTFCKLLERIINLRKNFHTCEQGIEFWEKTSPLWNRMTQCLEESMIQVYEEDEPETLSKAYEDEKIRRTLEEMTTVEEVLPSLIQQIMMNGENYNMTDEMVIEVVGKAKLLSESESSAAEIIQLTRRIVEDEADINDNVNWVVRGLVERGIFEFTKKKIAKTVFVNVRTTIDRLQHMNDVGLVPKKLIRSKNKAEVTKVIYDLIGNDNIYGHFDEPFDDDPDYVNLVTKIAKTSAQLFPMNHRRILLERIEEAISRFLELVRNNISHFVCTTRINELEEFKRKSLGKSKVTMPMVYRISRKLARIVLGMFPTDERKQHNIKATINAYKGLVIKRTSRIIYTKKAIIVEEVVDLDYCENLLNDVDPIKNKKIKPHGSFL